MRLRDRLPALVFRFPHLILSVCGTDGINCSRISHYNNNLMFNHILNRLKKLVEDTYKTSGNEKVVLVSHSLGGLTISTFLHSVSQQWKDTYLHAWVSAAGVFGGAVKVC